MMDVASVFRRGEAALPSAASRREFLRLAGMGAGALAALSLPLAAACNDDSGTNPIGGAALTLDFAQPLDVLRYAYALEALEADFYTRVVAAGGFQGAFPAAAERQLLTDVRDHEVAHREFLRAAITASGGTVPALSTRLEGALDFGSRTAVLATAQTFEDLGVAAYNGAGRYLVSQPALLTIAGKIVSVEARHASAIRDLVSPNTDRFANVSGLPGADEALGLDARATPAQVLAAAQPFVAQTITARNA